MDTCMTVWHWPTSERWYDEGLRLTLQRIRDAGFTHVNWNPDAGSSYMLGRAEIEFTAALVREAGLKVHSLHASNGRNPVSEVRWRRGPEQGRETRKDIGSVHEWQRLGGVDLVQNRIDLAQAFGAPDVVLHVDITDAAFADADSEAAFLAPYFASFDALMPYAVERGVAIAVETLFCAGRDSWLKLYDRLFSRYPQEFIGLNLDTGHWEMVEPGGLSVLDQFGERLISTHIHDNFGAMDDHLLPFDGRIDWSAVTRAIAATPYRTPLTFETPMDRYGLPETAFYARAQDVAQRLETMVAAARAAGPGAGA